MLASWHTRYVAAAAYMHVPRTSTQTRNIMYK